MIYAAANGELPVVEYLIEAGANVEATNQVQNVMIEMTFLIHAHVIVSVWIYSIDLCSKERPFAGGPISGSDRSEYQCEEQCKSTSFYRCNIESDPPMGQEGWTALTNAAASGNLSVISFLLNNAVTTMHDPQQVGGESEPFRPIHSYDMCA